jgi:hypothetical protein
VSTESTETTKLTGTSSADGSKGDRSAWPEWMNKHIPGIEGGLGTEEFRGLFTKFVQLEASMGFAKGQVSPDAIYTNILTLLWW